MHCTRVSPRGLSTCPDKKLGRVSIVGASWFQSFLIQMGREVYLEISVVAACKCQGLVPCGVFLHSVIIANIRWNVLLDRNMQHRHPVLMLHCLMVFEVSLVAYFSFVSWKLFQRLACEAYMHCCVCVQHHCSTTESVLGFKLLSGQELGCVKSLLVTVFVSCLIQIEDGIYFYSVVGVPQIGRAHV